jgi:hypothetical protein
LAEPGSLEARRVTALWPWLAVTRWLWLVAARPPPPSPSNTSRHVWTKMGKFHRNSSVEMASVEPSSLHADCLAFGGVPPECGRHLIFKLRLPPPTGLRAWSRQTVLALGLCSWSPLSVSWLRLPPPNLVAALSLSHGLLRWKQLVNVRHPTTKPEGDPVGNIAPETRRDR